MRAFSAGVGNRHAHDSTLAVVGQGRERRRRPLERVETATGGAGGTQAPHRLSHEGCGRTTPGDASIDPRSGAEPAERKVRRIGDRPEDAHKASRRSEDARLDINGDRSRPVGQHSALSRIVNDSAGRAEDSVLRARNGEGRSVPHRAAVLVDDPGRSEERAGRKAAHQGACEAERYEAPIRWTAHSAEPDADDGGSSLSRRALLDRERAREN
jgi:hypothetical protein